MHNIDGEWFGIYHYLGRLQNHPLTPSTKFRANFTTNSGGNVLTGIITDENYLGQAEVAGKFTDRCLRFTKTYNAPDLPPGLLVAPIFYEGTLSEDETTLSGVWLVRQRILGVLPVHDVHGTWEAYRKPINHLTLSK